MCPDQTVNHVTGLDHIDEELLEGTSSNLMVRLLILFIGLSLFDKGHSAELPGCFQALEFAVDEQFFTKKEIPRDGDWIEFHYTKNDVKEKDSRNGVDSYFFKKYLARTYPMNKCGYPAVLRIEFRVIGNPAKFNQIRLVWLRKNTYAVIFREY
jgi:hypothetical protein